MPPTTRNYGTWQRRAREMRRTTCLTTTRPVNLVELDVLWALTRCTGRCVNCCHYNAAGRFIKYGEWEYYHNRIDDFPLRIEVPHG